MDNFDLKKYIGSKRLLTENFEINGKEQLDEITPEMAVGLIPSAGFAATMASLIGSGVLTALENGSLGEKGKDFADKFKKLTKKDNVNENEDEDEDFEFEDDFYKVEDDDMDLDLDDMSDLDDYELPEKFAWEDDL